MSRTDDLKMSISQFRAKFSCVQSIFVTAYKLFFSDVRTDRAEPLSFGRSIL